MQIETKLFISKVPQRIPLILLLNKWLKMLHLWYLYFKNDWFIILFILFKKNHKKYFLCRFHAVISIKLLMNLTRRLMSLSPNLIQSSIWNLKKACIRTKIYVDYFLLRLTTSYKNESDNYGDNSCSPSVTPQQNHQYELFCKYQQLKSSENFMKFFFRP